MKYSSILRLKIKTRLWFRAGFVIVLGTIAIVYQSFNQNTIFDEHISRSLEGDGCPPPADPKWSALFYCFGVLYMFIGLAIIADDFFVPALDIISEKLNLSPDVAGATLMAAGMFYTIMYIKCLL